MNRIYECSKDWDEVDERERALRRRRRIEEMKRAKEKERKLRKMMKIGGIVLAAFLVVFICGKVIFGGKGKDESIKKDDVTQESQNMLTTKGDGLGADRDFGLDTDRILDNSQGAEYTVVDTDHDTVANPDTEKYSFTKSDSMLSISGEVISDRAIMIDMDNSTVVAQRDAYSRMSPASMTKILTVLVAAEHVTNLDDMVTITREITDYGYINDCSSTGFEVDEKVSVRDLFYGTILPSGADSAVALACYVAGSHEAFVDMMNDKLKSLGLSETAHFTNCVGVYDEEHYCTIYDMAVIMRAAIANDFCKEVLSAHTYTTSETTEHPEGIIISNWFLRRIEDKETGGEIMCAKTGFVVQSKNCAASFGVSEDGKEYICVTGGSTSSWRCIYDHVAIYRQFMM